MTRLSGQTAIVTGGNAGIGRAIAKLLAHHGVKVAIFGTNGERGASIVEEIRKECGEERAVFFKVNVAIKGEVDEAVGRILKEFGKIDILVNNAGITRDQLLMRMDERDWDDVMDINSKSCYNLCHAIMRSMIKARKGKIVNISSVVGLVGNAGQTNYAASKAAIIGFSKALAKEVASRGICVNCVAPGFIKTQMTDVLNDDQQRETLAQIPMGRMGTPDDIAHVVLFLVQPESDYITGQVITVDGGMVM